VSAATEMLHECTVAQANVAAPAEPVCNLSVTVIEPHPAWQFIDPAELWKYRELLLFLVWRDVKVRYKQTVLGAAWAVIQPLATMLVFSFFLGRLAAVPTADVPYPLFVFAGLLPWIFFAGAVTSSSQSIIGNQNLVTKVYFPRLLIPTSAAGVGLVDFAIAFVMLLALMLGYGVLPGWRMLLVPLLVLGLAIAALGVGTLLAALTVAYRDFRHVVPFLIQVWMFATACIYMQAEAVVGPQWQAVLPLNPAYGLISNFRQAVMDRPLDLYSLGISGAMSLALLVVGCAYFRRVERTFADII
jgi:lipopolysaccharide transport system permease protein